MQDDLSPLREYSIRAGQLRQGDWIMLGEYLRKVESVTLYERTGYLEWDAVATLAPHTHARRTQVRWPESVAIEVYRDRD